MHDSVSAGAGVHPYLVRQTKRLRRYRKPAQRGEEDAVHQMRVATRRLRSLLATYGHLYSEIPISRRSLRWLAAALGEVRDLEVLRMRFAAELGDERPDWFRALESDERRAYDRLAAAFRRRRFEHLMIEADAMATRPHFSADAVESASVVLGPVLEAAEADLASAFAAIASAPDPDEARHRARKTAKRVRYTAEAAAGALGERAESLAGKARRLQTVCGRFQDDVVALGYLEARAQGSPLLEAERYNRAADLEEVGLALDVLGVDVPVGQRQPQLS